MTPPIRRISPADGAALREVRLRALKTDPDAFESTYAEEAAKPADAWDRWAEASATGERACLFVADDDGVFGAMAGAYTPDKTPLTHRLIAMWVAPGLRKQGIGGALTSSILRWSAESGAAEVTLWVVDLDGPARRLYERAGFSLTEIEQALGSNPRLTKRLVRRSITAHTDPV
ncbi:MAG: GNAT family N-acetyltransferase [Acidimicrobiia bacterium]